MDPDLHGRIPAEGILGKCKADIWKLHTNLALVSLVMLGTIKLLDLPQDLSQPDSSVKERVIPAGNAIFYGIRKQDILRTMEAS